MMAVDLSCEGEPKIREFLDGNGSLPVSCSCLKLLKPSSDEVKQQVPLGNSITLLTCWKSGNGSDGYADIPPISEVPSILFEEASLPGELYQPLHSSLDQDLYSITVFPDEGDKVDCASPLAFFSILEVPDVSESLMSLDGQINCHSCIDFQMKSEELCSSCTIDVPTVNGNPISHESYEDGVESSKTRNFLTRVLWRQASLKGGRKTHANSDKPHHFKGYISH